MTETNPNPIINFGNYQEAATRTRSQLGSKSSDSAHMCLGIVGEFSEFSQAIENGDVPNIKEEGGDIAWYIAGECDIHGISFQELAEEVESIELDSYDKEEEDIADYVDFVKRQFAYGKECDVVKLRQFLRFFLYVVNSHCLIDAQTSLVDILQINVNKLFVRYGEKFSNFNALNRDLDAEAKTFND